jgi:hypothetical protein
MGAGAWKTLSSCCSRSETSGNFLKEDENKENENKLHEFEQIENGINKQLIGYNTQQKIRELKTYRFFINSLYGLMMINDSVEKKKFYFIKKSWIKSWYKYTCYEQIRPLLIKNEINNELDFHKIIIDHKKEINFEGFIEKAKPETIQFFEINTLNTNIKENFYIFDSKILKKFIEIYNIDNSIYYNKESFSLEGEIGKGRIIFDVKEYILIMVLNRNWEIKQIMVIFGKEFEHKQFINNIYGRALTYISKELKKIVQRKKMINYKKDEIFVYDDREFVKQEYLNNNKSLKKNNEIAKIENSDNNKIDFDKKTNKNGEDIITSNDRFKEI